MRRRPRIAWRWGTRPCLRLGSGTCCSVSTGAPTGRLSRATEAPPGWRSAPRCWHLPSGNRKRRRSGREQRAEESLSEGHRA
uniref:Putative secreted protein n=1 Tax=Ixodes ricinus TaxID=34613 RepID=A0A6B0UDZ8_IXORI